MKVTFLEVSKVDIAQVYNYKSFLWRKLGRVLGKRCILATLNRRGCKGVILYQFVNGERTAEGVQ